MLILGFFFEVAMKTVFVLLSLFFIIIMAAFCAVLRHKKILLSKSLFRLNVAGIISIFLYIISIFDFGYNAAVFFNGVYYASIHWVIIYLFDFIFTLTDSPNAFPRSWNFHKIWSCILIIDTVSLLMNVFFHHAFLLEPFFLNNKFYCWNAVYKIPFYFHLICCYILLAIIFVRLAISIKNANKFYRYKYIIILSFLIFVNLINVFFIYADADFDFTVLTFAFVSAASTYFTIYSMPKKFETAMLKLVSDNISNGVLCFDINKDCIYSNNIARELLNDDWKFMEKIQEFLNDEKYFFGKRIELFKNGKKKILSMEFQVLKDLNEKVIGFYAGFDDITEKMRKAEEDEYNSTHDMLTGLFNRESFFQKADAVIRNDSDTERLMLCFNIKNFKLVNDIFGSSYGDEILKFQGDFLNHIKGDDTLCGRISGDRFAVLIRKEFFSPKIADDNNALIQEFTSKLNYRLHIFIGVYEITGITENSSVMFDKAELAIRNVGENYNRSVFMFNSNFLSQVMRDKNILGTFQTALADNQFKVYFQPQVRSSDEKVIGAEALVRWHTPSGEIIYPAEFLNVLEKTGFLYKLDKFIWIEAAKILEKWQNEGIDYYIAVNVSPKDFYYLDIYKIFTDLKKHFNFAPEKLKLEITETVLMHDLEMHRNIIDRLRAEGFLVEMDDFGSGYSSLNLLKEVDVNVLKIDMAFLQKTANKQRGEKILQVVNEMAKKLNIETVVEGVENLEQAEFLRKTGFDVLQGYLYSKPLSVDEFEKTYCEGI